MSSIESNLVLIQDYREGLSCFNFTGAEILLAKSSD